MAQWWECLPLTKLAQAENPGPGIISGLKLFLIFWQIYLSKKKIWTCSKMRTANQKQDCSTCPPWISLPFFSSTNKGTVWWSIQAWNLGNCQQNFSILIGNSYYYICFYRQGHFLLVFFLLWFHLPFFWTW